MAKIPNPPAAWVHRTSPSGIDQLDNICLKKNVIVNGWSGAHGLEKISDWYEMREKLKKDCYPTDENYRRAGMATSSMWRFLRDMKPGDYVVVPHRGGMFYVARITGDAFVDDGKSAVGADAIYRRPVTWLNHKEGIPRTLVKSGLRSRMKIRQTTAAASEFVADIESALNLVVRKESASNSNLFPIELRKSLAEATLAEIHAGYMDERKFEELIVAVMTGMGFEEAKIIGRRSDKGVDIRAEYVIGRTVVVIGVQAKWHKGETEAHWLDHFVEGLVADGIDTGWFITSADFSEDFEVRAAELSEKHGKEIQAINGRDFAEMVVDYTLESSPLS